MDTGNMKDVYIKCFKCKSKLNFSEQLREALDVNDVKTIPYPFLLNIWCEKCEDMMFMLQIVDTPETEEVYCKAMKKKIVIKKPKE